MHEYGVVQGLLSAVDECVRTSHGSRAVRIVVDVRGISGDEQCHLRETFEAFRMGTVAGDAELVLEPVPVDVGCLDCGAVSSRPDVQAFVCSDCGGRRARPLPGREIRLKSVEIEV